MSRSYIHNLPNEAFAVVEPAYKRGESRNKNARHLPHHLAGVSRGLDSADEIEIDYLKSALRHMNGIVPVTDSISEKRLRELAREHLNRHARELKLIGDKRGDAPDKRLSEGGGIIVPPERIELMRQSGIETCSDGTLSTCLVNDIGEIDASGFGPMEAILDEGGIGIDMDSVKPKEDHYLRFPVRALSKTYIESRYLDFSAGNALRDSMPLLKGVTIFPDHNPRIENWLGSVIGVEWSEKPAPPGIDAQLQVDGLANPSITRGLLNDPPAISRVSVNVRFEWRKSHDDMTSEEFWGALGRKVDGEIVRFIVTAIKGYGEISFVYMGADRYAKKKST